MRKAALGNEAGATGVDVGTMQGTKLTTKKRNAFLDALRESGNVTRSAAAANLSRVAAYDLRGADPEFAAAWESALDEATDALEAEARRRALDGLIRKKFTKDGEPVIDPATGEQYFEYEYSDTLLIFLLKGHRPDRFRERYEHTGPEGAPLVPPTLTVVINDGNSSTGTTK